MGNIVILTGSTGMIGKGVLYECLDDPSIEEVVAINRSSLGIKHPKFRELLLDNFMNIRSLKAHIPHVDACFHCMGVSAVGLNEEQYSRITLEMTQNLADLMYDINPNMVFVYVSGAGTDSSETGRSMWARVKGRTENYILHKGFKRPLMFRPGAIIPERGITSRTAWYRFFYFFLRPVFPLLKRSNNVTTTTKIGQAMIRCLDREPALQHLENKNINQLAGS